MSLPGSLILGLACHREVDKGEHMKKKIIIIGAALVFVIVVVLGFSIYRQAQIARAAAQGFDTAEVRLGSLAATIDAAGSVRSNQSAILSWQTSGTLAQVNVKVGDVVQAGDLLAELEQTSLSQNVILAQADLYAAQQALEDLQNYELQSAQSLQDLDNAQQALEDLLNPNVALTLAQTEVALLDADEALADAIKDRERLNYQRCENSTIESYEAQYYLALDRYKNQQDYYNENYAPLPTTDPDRLNAMATLLDMEEQMQMALANVNWCKGMATEAEIAQADADVALAKERVSDAQTQISDLQAGPDPVEVALAEARVAEAQRTYDDIKDGPSAEELASAEARVAAAQSTLDTVRITAPFDGVITMVENKPGDQINAGMQAFRIDDLSRILVDLGVSEVDINQVEIGQPVVLTFDAIIGKEYHGQVVEAGLVGVQNQGVVNFNVTIEMTDADADVLPGMTCAVGIVTSQIDNALLVPTEAIRTVNGQRVVYVLGAAPAIQETPVATEATEEGFGPMGMGLGAPAAPAGTRMVEITLGATSFTYCQVTGGDLKVGDIVILNPPDNISPMGEMGR